MTAPRKMTFAAGALVVAMSVFAASASPPRPTIVDRVKPEQVDTLPFLERNDGIYVPVSAALSRAGYTCRWDSVSGRLACRRKGDSLLFLRSSAFFSVNDSLFQVPRAPISSPAELFLPPACLVEALQRATADSVFWNDTLARLFLGCAPEPPASPPPEKRGAPRPRTAARVQEQAIKTIVIDPGHGGRDPGAVGAGGTREKDVVLAMALILRDKLRKEKGLTVLMTREKDEFIPLGKRTKFANDRKADLFVSIHANSIGGTRQKKEETKGYKTYFLSHAKNEEDKLVAMRENSVIELEAESEKRDFLRTVLTSLAGNEYLAESQDMSIMITEILRSGLKRMGPLHLGVGQANFYVLNGAYMPAVLVETGFISHPDEEKMLAERKFQDEMASAIFKAIVEFKRKYDQFAEGSSHE